MKVFFVISDMAWLGARRHGGTQPSTSALGLGLPDIEQCAVALNYDVGDEHYSC